MKLYHGSTLIVDKPLVSYGRDNLDFVLACRGGSKEYQNYDTIEGGIANDKVFNTVELFFTGLIDKSTALQRLKFEKTNNQICFINQEVVDNHLHFESIYEAKGEQA